MIRTRNKKKVEEKSYGRDGGVADGGLTSVEFRDDAGVGGGRIRART